MNFNVFKQAVATQFAKMAKSQLFVTATTGDDLWATYLAAFPEGTNPVYRERTEHDCSCCKQFIRNIGNVVTIQDGKLVSIWDIVPTNSPYDLVAAALSSAVKAHPIANMYRHYERSVGTDKNFEQLVTGQKAWEHFYVTLPATVVMDKRSIPTKLGEYREAHQMLTRALATISDDAIDTVLELISQNSLYRGAEHKGLVTAFNDMRKKYLAFFGLPKDLFIWSVAASGSSAVTGIRNSVIGTLLVDLSEGVPMERAVASFEAKVAPTNYKRPTALVTKAMIEAAKKTVQDLGLLSALERRYATIDDIKIGNILFASTNARRTLVKDVFDDLSSKVAAKPNLDKVEEVSIDKFLADILPTINHMEVLVENRHMGNLVSLVAPADPTAPSLFKWNNAFSWSYQGDMADSIKERVKQAGGNVTGELCCRLAWDYSDDLDLHMYEPRSGHIFYAVRRRKSIHGGMLDVDANGMDGLVENPVENIFYEKLSTMGSGEYTLWVNNFARRSPGVGFEVEIDLLGQVTRLGYDKVITSNEKIKVATLTKTPAGVEVTPHLPSTQSSKSVWGVATHTFVPVTVMMLSPNFWEDTGSGIGNKHYLFMLDGCQNDGSARGFFNEFLKPELDQHRKVIEMVGSRMKTEEAGRQLSGLGFSSTQRNSVTCRITGSFTRNITINF
ncbi:MAG: hypothetical protein IPN20_04575 [Haliscomenobacter sp.]|nr:hypothetical protein [Haliscomenobacter sp.]